MRAERTLYMRHSAGNPKTRGKGYSAGISAPFITASFFFLYFRGKKEEKGRYKNFTRLLVFSVTHGS